MIETFTFQRYAQGIEHPPVEDIEEFIADMTELSHAMGKGVRRLAQYPGAEFIMPPALSEWSEPDKNGYATRIADKQIALRRVALGAGAWRMQAIHNHTVHTGERYDTTRRMYWFAWKGDDVFESQSVLYRINSDPTSIFEPSPAENVPQLRLGTTERHASAAMVLPEDFDGLVREGELYADGLKQQLANSTTDS